MEQSLTLVDSHVHIYDCFPLGAFLASALKNFSAQAQRHQTVGFTGVLLLTESQGAQWFERLLGWADSGRVIQETPARGWVLHRTAEKTSVRAESTCGGQLFLVAGRQVVTTEKLEVLALFTECLFPDGASLDHTVTAIRHNGGIPVIPWAFGKWWGRRGSLLTEYLCNLPAPDVFLGDNSGRPGFLPEPSQFRLAKQQKRLILPGSDPLPIPNEFWRPGLAGVILKGPISSERPATHLKELLLNPQTSLVPYHQTDTLFRFVKNFIALRTQQH